MGTKGHSTDARIQLQVKMYFENKVKVVTCFITRYVTDLVCDAKLLSQHARKRTIDAEDARLSALQMAEKYVSAPPARHVISQVTSDNEQLSIKSSLPPFIACKV